MVTGLNLRRYNRVSTIVNIQKRYHNTDEQVHRFYNFEIVFCLKIVIFCRCFAVFISTRIHFLNQILISAQLNLIALLQCFRIRVAAGTIRVYIFEHFTPSSIGQILLVCGIKKIGWIILDAEQLLLRDRRHLDIQCA